MTRTLLFLLILASSYGFSQNATELINNFYEDIENGNEECEIANITNDFHYFNDAFNEDIRGDFNWLRELHGFDTDLSEIKSKKDRKSVLKSLTNIENSEYIFLSVYNGYICAKEFCAGVVLRNENFKDYYKELASEINTLDPEFTVKIDSLNYILSTYEGLLQGQINLWEREINNIKKYKKLNTIVFLNPFTFAVKDEFKVLQGSYSRIIEGMQLFLSNNDLYYYAQLQEELVQKKSILNAEEIRADAINGDGVYVAKIIDRKWGMYQVWDKNPRTLVEPEYDSIGQLGWNDPFIKVWRNGKVGLHGMNFSDETDSLMVPCVYDQVIIGNVTGHQHEYLGKYCAVRKGEKWGFVNWINGEIIEPIEMANHKDIDSYGRVARKREW